MPPPPSDRLGSDSTITQRNMYETFIIKSLHDETIASLRIINTIDLFNDLNLTSEEYYMTVEF